MANYQEARVKLTNTQLNKLKSAAKNKRETILRLSKKSSEDIWTTISNSKASNWNKKCLC